MNKNVWLGVGAGALVLLALGSYVTVMAPATSDGNSGSATSSPASGALGNTAVPGASTGMATGAATAQGGAADTAAQLAATSNSRLPGAAASAPSTALTELAARSAATGLPARTGSLGLNTLVNAQPPVIGRAGAPSIQDIQNRLLGLTANGRQPSAKEVDAVLADLQLNQGSSVISGINIQALRDNLVRVDRVQQIAAEMQAIAANPTKDSQARLNTLMGEMKNLQGGLSNSAAQISAAGAAKK